MPLIMIIHRTIRCGDFKQFVELLENKKRRDSFDVLAIINTLDLSGKSFLSTAAQAGSLNFVRELLQAGADVDLPDWNGDRPLYGTFIFHPLYFISISYSLPVACMQENKEVVAYLLMHGASRDAIPRLDNLIRLDWFRDACIEYNNNVC
jgi:ankyrin repeat protein